MIAPEHSSFVSKTALPITPCPRATSGREKAPSSDFCHSSSPDTPAPCFVGDNFTANLVVSDDLDLAGVQAAECLTCPSHDLESAVFDAIMKEISLLPVKTVGHLPRSLFDPCLLRFMLKNFDILPTMVYGVLQGSISFLRLF